MSVVFRLYYFDGRGLGERVRCMMAECGEQYQDIILTKQLMAELRETGRLLYQQVPLLEIDGLQLVQSGAIMRYLARKHNLCGGSQQEAAQCDMLYEGLSDCVKLFLPYPFQQNKPAYLTEKVDPVISRYLQPMNDALARNNGGEEKGYLLGAKLSYPDLLLLEVLEYTHELLPSQLSKYPLLASFRTRMRQRPSMRQFYTSGMHRATPDDIYAAHVAEVLGWK